MERSQVAKGLCLLILLLFIPFISSSLRTSYLYFLLNLLIIALGMEAGFLHAISRPHDEKKLQNNTPTTASISIKETAAGEATGSDVANKAIVNRHQLTLEGAKSLTEKMAVAQKTIKKISPRAQTLKRCSSKPSLFFIGNGTEGESAMKESATDKQTKFEMAEELSKQELYAKAEAYIGNFYMQLKMQREASWKKINEFYHKAF